MGVLLDGYKDLISKQEDGLLTIEEVEEELSSRPKMYIKEKTSYGRTLFYPACYKSRTYAETLGRKTLSIHQLKFMEEMGIKVECQTNDYWHSRF